MEVIDGGKNTIQSYFSFIKIYFYLMHMRVCLNVCEPYACRTCRGLKAESEPPEAGCEPPCTMWC